MDSGTFTYLKRFVGLEIGNCMVSSGVAKRDLFPEIRRFAFGDSFYWADCCWLVVESGAGKSWMRKNCINNPLIDSYERQSVCKSICFIDLYSNVCTGNGSIRF